MSIRFGSSREVPRRANERRWRGASTGAKTAAPSEEVGRGQASRRKNARPVKIAQRCPPPEGRENGLTVPVPRLHEYVAERFLRDGCGYWPAARIPATADFANAGTLTAVKSGHPPSD